MNKNLLLWTIIVALIIGAGTGIFFLGRASKVCDTVSIAPINIPDTNNTGKIVFKEKKVPVYKEVTIMQLDSIYREAFNYYKAVTPKDTVTVYKDKPQTFGMFTATKDSTYRDSLNKPIARLKAELRSRIPIDPELQWLQDFTFYQNTVIHEVPKPKTFFDRFGACANTSFGFGWIHKQFDFYSGVGLHFEL